jgi:hypothetical protein
MKLIVNNRTIRPTPIACSLKKRRSASTSEVTRSMMSPVGVAE